MYRIGGSDMPEQVPFSNVDLMTNTEPRCPCVLLLDTSGSMKGQPIADLNAGLIQFKDELSADALATKRVELSIITFGEEVTLVQEFASPDSFTPPTLIASGPTPMGEAINKGLDTLQDRKEVYRQAGINCYRPWVFLITDGGPTDNWKPAANRVKEGDAGKKFSFFGIAVEGANVDILKEICTRAPLKLKETRFRELFVWLSRSLKSVSSSRVGDAVPLTNPATPDGWASV
jgi:uncharacterized protein YegL